MKQKKSLVKPILHCPTTYHPVSLLLCSLLGRLGRLATLGLRLLHTFDDSYGNCLLHVTNGKTPKRRVVGKRFNTHWLTGYHLHDGSVSTLHHLGVVFEFLAASSVNLLKEFRKLACNVSSVAIEDRCIASVDLTRVIQDDNL